MLLEETPTRSTQNDDCRPWMEDFQDMDPFGKWNSTKRGRSPLSKRRRSPTPAKESMPKRKFNELLLAMRSMTEVMQNQTTKFDAWFIKKEALRRNMRPPCSIPENEEEPIKEDTMERNPSLRRLHSLRDRGSNHHISMSHQEHVFIRSHSHRAL